MTQDLAPSGSGATPATTVAPSLAAAPVLVSLGAYGASEVRRHGQLTFARIALAAGADGLEVRGELQPDEASAALAEIDAIARLARQHRAALVYSSPEGLWDAEARLDESALARGLETALRLGAPQLKMSIGGYHHGASTTLATLAARLREVPVTLLIENDQTATAGTVTALEAWVADARRHALPVALTFDLGNWHWLGECPLEAARALGPQVRYVHCKGVERQGRRWVAVPLAESAAAWRASLALLPAGLPWAIEYPLVGDDLVAVTRRELQTLRDTARQLQRHPPHPAQHPSPRDPDADALRRVA